MAERSEVSVFLPNQYSYSLCFIMRNLQDFVGLRLRSGNEITARTAFPRDAQQQSIMIMGDSFWPAQLQSPRRWAFPAKRYVTVQSLVLVLLPTCRAVGRDQVGAGSCRMLAGMLCGVSLLVLQWTRVRRGVVVRSAGRGAAGRGGARQGNVSYHACHLCGAVRWVCWLG